MGRFAGIPKTKSCGKKVRFALKGWLVNNLQLVAVIFVVVVNFDGHIFGLQNAVAVPKKCP